MYKLVHNEEIVDVVETACYVKLQKNGVVVACDESKATGILSSDGNTIYSVGVYEKHGDFVQVEQISEEEYNVYKERLEKNEVVTKDTYQEMLSAVDVLDYVISTKVAEMSSKCNQAITNGVDVELTDGRVAHFSLTTDDQLNLSTMQAGIINGMEQFSYHCDGGDCEFFSKEDILRIMEASENWKVYHMTYFNSLRKYIRSLSTVEEVRAIEYGIPVPVEFQTDVLKAILGGGVK